MCFARNCTAGQRKCKKNNFIFVSFGHKSEKHEFWQGILF